MFKTAMLKAAMLKTVRLLWQEEDGVLSFEWSLLGVIVVFGIVGGLAGARDAIIDELGDTAQALLSIDQSYSFAGIPGVLDASVYTDVRVTVIDCDRNFADVGVPPLWDNES
ncbi:hypothetical protein ETAA8_61820 [Anatilimnocola aggregata]|uniref:Uncharacterized protein n=1 Tax=Anatilimnocola aggregata TaxID=2528021 RepID=A0A517YLD4_9BACT|nr:hypothetical protein [Anatilimnocola aggregata]QDU31029.1 hypothetical protein ETAA8_61820 [Anatilimnocola aggregata]